MDTYLEGHLGEQFISNVSLVEQDLALSESSKNEVLEEEGSKSLSGRRKNLRMSMIRQ